MPPAVDDPCATVVPPPVIVAAVVVVVVDVDACLGGKSVVPGGKVCCSIRIMKLLLGICPLSNSALTFRAILDGIL